MIQIVKKEDCVGCNACVQICPKACIKMEQDVQGFSYPVVNKKFCIECNLCEKVCPVINQYAPIRPQKTFAAKNKDSYIQNNSSSGGVFYALAEFVINAGGIVFGVKFNEKWDVVHGYAESLEEICLFQTSKYVQSDISSSFITARDFLKQGKKVLFSGTPCQIAGLNRFLKRDYGDQLLKVDIVCHGVPSPGIWKVYRESLFYRLRMNQNLTTNFIQNEENPIVTGINFRDKKLGWEKYGFSICGIIKNCDKYALNKYMEKSAEEKELFFETHSQNVYMQGFLKDLYLRPSCYCCPSKSGKSHSDISLADFWGIRRVIPKFYSENGVSLLIVYSTTGLKALDSIALDKVEIDYRIALSRNPAIESSAKIPKYYTTFWDEYQSKQLSAISNAIEKMQPNKWEIFSNKLIRIINRYIRKY